MRQVIRVLACSSLVAASCWSLAQAQTTEATRAGSAPTGTESRLPQSPRELLKRGKELYLQGHYAKAAEVLETISADDESLSPAEKNSLGQYLESAIRKAADVGGRSDGVTTRGQSPQGEVLAALKGEAQRLAKLPVDQRRVAANKWLKAARDAYNHGDFADAEQIALLTVSLDAGFKANEDSPQRLLSEIQDARKQEMAWKNDQSSPQAKQNRVKYLSRRAEQASLSGDKATAQQFAKAAAAMGGGPPCRLQRSPSPVFNSPTSPKTVRVWKALALPLGITVSC